MTLAEALILRSDIQRKIDQLQGRLMDNVQVQEGDQPLLSPEDIKKELFQLIDRLTRLVQAINNTNNNCKFSDELLISEALAKRDGLSRKINILNNVLQRASISTDRYSLNEIKFVTTIDFKEIQAELDQVSKEWRELDTEIQKINWATNLKEV